MPTVKGYIAEIENKKIEKEDSVSWRHKISLRDTKPASVSFFSDSPEPPEGVKVGAYVSIEYYDKAGTWDGRPITYHNVITDEATGPLITVLQPPQEGQPQQQNQYRADPLKQRSIERQKALELAITAHSAGITPENLDTIKQIYEKFADLLHADTHGNGAPEPEPPETTENAPGDTEGTAEPDDIEKAQQDLNSVPTLEQIKAKGKGLGLKPSEIIKLANAKYGVQGLDGLAEGERLNYWENMEDLAKTEGMLSTEPEESPF